MNAQLNKKPVFYYNSTSGEIMAGLPEAYPAPYGFEKIVCTSAREAEQWSARQRKWDEFKHRLKMEERELIEGPMRDQMRKHLHHLMANSRNNVNRDFLKKSLENFEKNSNQWKYKRESFLHAEAFEHGH